MPRFERRCPEDDFCVLDKHLGVEFHWAGGLSWQIHRLFDNRLWRWRTDEFGRRYTHTPHDYDDDESEE